MAHWEKAGAEAGAGAGAEAGWTGGQREKAPDGRINE